MVPERKPEFPNSLTPREVDVLSLMANGQLNQEIAQTLNLPRSEVKHCVTSIIEKLGVETAGQAGLLYLQRPFNPHFTPRQIEVLEAVAMGLSDPEIAERMAIKPYSVRNHFSRQPSRKRRSAPGIFTKLNISSRREAVVKAIELGLLDPLKLTQNEELERVKRLTRREKEILKRLSDPSSSFTLSPTWIIARDLRASKRTVQRDLVSIYHKLGIQVIQRSTAALTRAVVIFSAYQMKISHETRRVHLTPRQLEVLKGAAMGLSNSQIAESLQIMTPTVKTLFSQQVEKSSLGIFVKLNVSSRREAVVKAINSGLIDPKELTNEEEVQKLNRLNQQETSVLQHLSDPTLPGSLRTSFAIAQRTKLSRRKVDRTLMSIYRKLDIQLGRGAAPAIRAAVIFLAHKKKRKQRTLVYEQVRP